MQIIPHLTRAATAAVGVLALATGVVAPAMSAVVDPFQLDGSEQRFGINTLSNPSGQSFVMGTTGRIDALELSLEVQGSPLEAFSISLIDLSGGDFAAAPALATVLLGPGDLGPSPDVLDLATVTATLIDFSAFDVQAAAGDVLGFRFFSSAVPPADSYVINVSLSDPYADGAFYSIGSVSVAGRDAAFKVFVTPDDVPAPGGFLILLGAGVVLFAARRAR